MRRVARPLALFVVVIATLVACRGDGRDEASPTSLTPTTPSPAPSPSPSPASPSPTGSTTSSPVPEPDLQLPPDAPATFDGDVTADGDPSSLVPPGAEVVASASLATPADPIDQLALAWRRGDPFASELGVVVWQRFDEAPAWRAVFAFTDAPARGVLGIQLVSGDLTGDGIPDLLTREDRGGSGACATWRVIAPTEGGASQVLRRGGCDTAIELAGDGTLSMREAVFEPGDSHCCPSSFRTATLEWDGSTFVATDVRESPAPAP